jgi:neurocalcin delta
MGNRPTKLSKEDVEYLLNNTSYSRTQIKKWYRGFMKDCPSGQLTRRRFLSIYRNLFPDGRAGAFYEHVFRTLDEDGSGTIDFKEFLQAISITQTGKPEDKLELAFRLYDINRNGIIEEHEMVEIIKAIYLMTDTGAECIGDAPYSRTREIFSKMDCNRDGVLSKDEFIKGCLDDVALYSLLACKMDDECR